MLQHGKRPTIASRHGMVAAAHPIAAAAGARVLSNGGNAFDAAAWNAGAITLAEPIVGTCCTVDTDLPRIRFVFRGHRSGDIRALIDAVNQFAGSRRSPRRPRSA